MKKFLVRILTMIVLSTPLLFCFQAKAQKDYLKAPEEAFSGHFTEFPSGENTITRIYDNGSLCTIYPNGSQEGLDTEGNHYVTVPDGTLTVTFTDGTIGIFYTDGRAESCTPRQPGAEPCPARR